MTVSFVVLGAVLICEGDAHMFFLLLPIYLLYKVK